ncbi:uncharacterized protein LOC141666008 [Apium graveolens]|uniref:uncharacterized protein LOC141666008 n=1 Tax=Apium graveolens TaxID=4045 RepID=UPI003D78B90E
MGEAEDPPIEGEGIEEVIQEMETMLEGTETPEEISLNAIDGHKSMGTVRLLGTIKKHPVSILIDSGSTHSFIDKALVKRLKIAAEVISPLIVTAADESQVLVKTACKQLNYSIQGHLFNTEMRLFSLGGSDMVLGVDWLQKHNPVTFDFNLVNITINKEGDQVILQGERNTGSLKTISCKKLNKLIQQKGTTSQGFLCLISACPEESVEVPTPAILPEIQTLIKNYPDIFEEPKGLPPSRSHDHHIPLLQGS